MRENEASGYRTISGVRLLRSKTAEIMSEPCPDSRKLLDFSKWRDRIVLSGHNRAQLDAYGNCVPMTGKMGSSPPETKALFTNS
jgi:hypothetical protein